MSDPVAWLKEFILEFRKEAEKLPEKERQRITNLDNFSPPCQVLLLWFQNPSTQYLIFTHDEKMKDLDLKVVGPIPTHKAIETLEAILKNPGLDRELSDEEKKFVVDKNITFAEILESLFLNIVHEIRNAPFREPVSVSLVGSKVFLTAKSFYWTIWGNIAEIDRAQLIGETVRQAKEDAARETKPASPPPISEAINSHSTYFYPPIWVGKLPKKSFAEKAHGSFIFSEKALDAKYRGRVVVVNQDGLIAIGEEDISKATRFLNEIMATFAIRGFESSAIRELEVCEGKIDALSLLITSYGVRSDTQRTRLFGGLSHELILDGRIEIEKDQIIRTIKEAEKINSDPETSDFLTFLLQSNTHLKNSEYSQSFIMSWVIVERQISWLWGKFLKEEQIPRKRRDKLCNPRYWTIDFILEVLDLRGQLTKEEYVDYMDLKDKRNDMIHLGEGVSLEDAEKCYRIATDIVKKRVGF